jgi:enoyl-[acyl-carrier protein] reductase I
MTSDVITSSTQLLAGKRLLITGVVNTDSIAYATAVAAIDAGAEIVLSSLGRDIEHTRETAQTLGVGVGVGVGVEVIEADLTEPDALDSLADHLRNRWGHLDGVLHAVAFAPREALSESFLDASIDPVTRAFHTSVHTYATLARLLRDLAPSTGGSLVGLDFDATRAWPVYNWMGVCKSALESTNRYVARDLGRHNIRANLIAAGPLHTRAAGAIGSFERLLDAWEHQSPMTWNPHDATPVADATVFLLSDLARMITGEILHVDGGYHAMAAHLDTPA